MGQIFSPYVAKSLGQSLGQISCFIKGQFLAQIKNQIVEQIGCVDAALISETIYFSWTAKPTFKKLASSPRVVILEERRYVCSQAL